MLQSKSIRLLIIFLILFVLLACSTSSENATKAGDSSAAVATLAPTITSAPTLKPTSATARVKVTKNTNCRSGPSTDYSIVVTLPAGSEAEVFGRNSGSDFYYVHNPDHPSEGCWIWRELATVISGEIAILPIFTPAALPMPAVPQPTAAPACERSGTVSIKNDTGGTVTVYMTGTASFTFNVAAGNQTISVCPGSYKYTAYGCGGASRTGTVNDGDEIEFWCE
jgi:hypothetical protein